MPRSAPRSVEQRRREIVAAMLPLFEEEGFRVSTRRIADAAGIAEGTIFRVFATKEELMRTAIGSYLDPGDLIARLEGIDPDLELSDKVVGVVDIVQESALRIHTFMLATRGRLWGSPFNWRPAGVGPEPPGFQTSPDGFHPPFIGQARALKTAIEQVLAPHQGELSVDLETAASYLLATGIAFLIVTSIPSLTDSTDFVALTLRAIIRKETE